MDVLLTDLFLYGLCLASLHAALGQVFDLATRVR